MVDYETDEQSTQAEFPAPDTAAVDAENDSKQAEKAQVTKLIAEVKADKKFHKNAFERMRRDMRIATWGKDKNWKDGKYTANITGRHIRTKTNALYAKNPKAVARRHDTLDFVVWDESEQSLMIAMQTLQMAAQMAATAPQVVDEMTGQVVSEPQLPPGFEQAQAIVEDYQQGMERRTQMKRFGRTLEVLFARALREQKPLDFKTAMKKVVRRACTTSVGYVEIGFHRETGMSPQNSAKAADFSARLAHLRVLMERAQEGEIEPLDAEMAELEASLAAIQAEPEVVLNQGLTFDFHQSTRVIPDRHCKSLVGFVGAERVSVEYPLTKMKVQEIYGVDLGKQYTAYTMSGEKGDGSAARDSDGQGELFEPAQKSTGDDYVCVWKIFDQPSGLEYHVCDGYDQYLKPPASPDVFVSDFWPIYALTFNDVENEEELFPPSDVTLIMDMQFEYNRSREGKREHRKAARPRWAFPNGALEEEDVNNLKSAEAFEAIGINMDPQAKIGDLLQVIPVPGVDPNLYDTGEIWGDMQVVAGSQQARLGGLAKASATESAISAGSSAESDGADIDDLDALLSRLARAGSQVLMREMDPQKVIEIVGPGAYWPPQTTAEISEEIYLEVEAGSTGKPNQAVEINNWKEMLPFLIQMGNIQPDWLAKETLRRLDDRMDLTEAVTAGIPSIVAQNAMASAAPTPQPSTGDPATDPNQQGGQGVSNGPAPPGGPVGSGPAFGSNQV
jgi:hypothetical protein